MGETVATVISKELSRKDGMWVCSERLQATLRIHYVGGRTSLSLQSHRPDAQDSVFIVFSARASSDGQLY